PEALDPCVALDPDHGDRSHQRGAVGLDVAVDLCAIRGSRQHERQQLDQVALRDIALRELPIEHDYVGAESYVALVEIVMDEGRGTSLLRRMPVRQGLDDGMPSAPRGIGYELRETRARVVEHAAPERRVGDHVVGRGPWSCPGDVVPPDIPERCVPAGGGRQRLVYYLGRPVRLCARGVEARGIGDELEEDRMLAG